MQVLTVTLKKVHFAIDRTFLWIKEFYLSGHPVPEDSSFNTVMFKIPHQFTTRWKITLVSVTVTHQQQHCYKHFIKRSEQM